MSGYLIDTNIVSELRKRDRAHPGVVQWFADHSTDDLWLSVLVAGELRRGAESIARRDPAAGESLRSWLAGVLDDYADRVLPVTMAVCQRWALLNVPDPIPVVDGLLAATALEHDLVLVTRNTGDVESTGVAIDNPFLA